MSTTAAQATALVTGSFLSGAMAALSLVAVPVLLDATPTAPQLFHAWARMYHYGHLGLPTLAICTLSLWTLAAHRRRRAQRPWRLAALAGATTVVMIPFTWLVMVPTNNELFRLEALGQGVLGEGWGLGEAKDLVQSWARLHLTRAVFPLAGAGLGAVAVFGGKG